MSNLSRRLAELEKELGVEMERLHLPDGTIVLIPSGRNGRHLLDLFCSRNDPNRSSQLERELQSVYASVPHPEDHGLLQLLRVLRASTERWQIQAQ